jgi:hypothetical protein
MSKHCLIAEAFALLYASCDAEKEVADYRVI